MVLNGSILIQILLILKIEFGKLLLYLFESTKQYGLSLQPSFVLLQKTLIHIEGMGRQIYPELDFWEIAEPYFDNWLNEQFSPSRIKDFIMENKEELIFKASEVPGMIYETLDELRNFSNIRQSYSDKIKKLENELSGYKNFIILLTSIGAGIIIIGSILSLF